MSNLVHTYVTGNSFANIYGGDSACMYGYITHMQQLSPIQQQRWPWIKNQWYLDNGRGYGEFFPTLRQAKQQARVWWPECGFKTRTQFLTDYEKIK
jgi:hypothetical protein